MSDPRPSSTDSDSNRGGDSTRNSNNKRSNLQPQLDQDHYKAQKSLDAHEKDLLDSLLIKMQEELLMLALWEQELIERLQRRKNKAGFLQ